MIRRAGLCSSPACSLQSVPITSTTTKVGPYTRRVTKLRLRKPTKAETRRENLVAVSHALGGVRTVAAVGVGAGGVAAIKEKASRARDRTLQQVSARARTADEGNVVVKALTIDDILATRVAKADEIDLVELHKAFGFLNNLGTKVGGKLGNTYERAMRSGWASNGVEGAASNARRMFRHTGGSGGLLDAVGQHAANPWVRNTAKVGAGLAGAGAAAYGAKKATGWLTGKATEKLAAQAAPIKRKALKYAGYGAAGLGGTVAAGTALGNVATNR